MKRLHDPIAHQLEQAAETALQGDLSSALEIAELARKKWEDKWHSTAIVADHAPMDEIDAHFARLPVYANMSHQADFAACCAQLAALITAIAEAHAFSWWNIL